MGKQSLATETKTSFFCKKSFAYKRFFSGQSFPDFAYQVCHVTCVYIESVFISDIALKIRCVAHCLSYDIARQHNQVCYVHFFGVFDQFSLKKWAVFLKTNVIDYFPAEICCTLSQNSCFHPIFCQQCPGSQSYI
jgi:hypothetical protein